MSKELSMPKTSAFWEGFEKKALNLFALRAGQKAITKAAPKAEAVVAKAAPAAAPAVAKAAPQAVPAVAKAAEPPTLNYAAMRAQELEKKRKPGGTLVYEGGKPTYHGPGKSPAESRAAAEAKLKEQAQKRMANATKGGYTDPQFKREL